MGSCPHALLWLGSGALVRVLTVKDGLEAGMCEVMC